MESPSGIWSSVVTKLEMACPLLLGILKLQTVEELSLGKVLLLSSSLDNEKVSKALWVFAPCRSHRPARAVEISPFTLCR